MGDVPDWMQDMENVRLRPLQPIENPFAPDAAVSRLACELT